jgi:hypothetical protein
MKTKPEESASKFLLAKVSIYEAIAELIEKDAKQSPERKEEAQVSMDFNSYYINDKIIGGSIHAEDQIGESIYLVHCNGIFVDVEPDPFDNNAISLN